MPVYYFEVETKQTGWIRIEAKNEKIAKDRIYKDGFEAAGTIAAGTIENKFSTVVTSVEGGEEQE